MKREWARLGTDWDEHLHVALEAADAGAEALRRYAGKIQAEGIDKKRTFDYVTEADLSSERAIISMIQERFPDHSIYAEESEKSEGTYRWIIDPLDGTTNFIHGYPVYAISVALEYRGQIVVGVVLDPTRNEYFYAVRGRGAYRNGERIRVSQLGEPSLGLLTTGFPFRSKDFTDLYLRSFKKLFVTFSGIRRAGAVAIDLAYLACGRCEGFWEIGLAPWDIAAGSLLIEEAGGRITDFSGGADHIWTGNVVASNGLVHDVILDVVREVFGGVIDR